MKSIGLFERALSKLDASLNAAALVQFLRNVNLVRQIDSHLMSHADMEKRLKKVHLPLDVSSFERGAQLIECVNNGLTTLIKSLK